MRRLALLLALVGVAAACNPPENLSTTESPILMGPVVSPTSYNFGSIEVGQASPSQNFRVSYAGFGDETVDSLSWSCPDFQITWMRPLPYYIYQVCSEPCDPCPLCFTPPQCCGSEADDWDFDAVFVPTVGALVSCTVNVNFQAAASKTVTLSGTGTLPPILIDVDPPSVGFGDVRRNTDSSAVDMTVRNAGSGTMTVSSVDISAGFAIMSGTTGGHTLGPGGSETFSIVCHPTATGAYGGNFTVHSNDPNYPDKAIPLSCNGIDSALDISPSPTTLATTRVGEPVQTSIDLQNTGGASMSLEGVSIAGTDLSMIGTAPTGNLGPGASVSVGVAFSAVTKGSTSGTLTVTYDGGQQRISQITARALGTSMSVTPDGDVQFGPVCAGQSKSQPFQLLANEEGSFRVSSLSTPGAPFAVTAPALPFVVQGSGANKLMFDVTAMPAVAGEQTATLSLTTDIPNAMPRDIKLTVTGITAGITPSPEQLDFGPNPINTLAIGQSVNLSNCSASAITFTRPRIEGIDASEFAIVTQPESATINPTNSASWLIVFQGHTVGAKTANFVVDYDGGVATIPLLGDGIGDTNPGENPDEISYYTCSSGSSAGSSFGLVVFVVGFVMWRRRRRR